MIYTARYIFIHVPKTGGQSVSEALAGNRGPYAKHAPLSDVKKGNRFAFGFVRDPWARMVSLYRFHCQKAPLPRDNYSRDETIRMGFKDWLLTDFFYMKQDICRDMLPMQRRPQLWWVDGCDFIGRLENIAEDWPLAMALAGEVPIPRLPHINSTHGGDWRAEYDAESRAFVAEHFAPDIERFGYQCAS